MNMHRLTLVGLSSAVLSLLTYACSGGDGGGSATPDAGDPAETGASDRAVENGDAAATGDDGGDAGTATSSDASSDAKAPDGGVCTPAWDGTLSFPAKGTRFVTGWQLVSATAPSAYVQSLSGTSATDVWYTGQMWGGKTSSFVAHYDGTSVRALLGLPQTTWPVAPVSANEVWLGPDLRYKDGVLSAAPVSAPGKAAMKFLTTNNGWSVGATGIWHWNGATWMAYGMQGAIVPYTAVDGDANDNIWAAAGTTLKRFNANAWVDPAAPLPDGFAITGLAVNGPSDVWVTGSGGLYHFDGGSWTQFSSKTTWSDVTSSGTGTVVTDGTSLGFVSGASVTVSTGESVPCTTNKCLDLFMPSGGPLFLGTAPTPLNGLGPFKGSGPTATSLVTSLLPPAGSAASGTIQLRRLPAGDLLAVNRGRLSRGTFEGGWADLTPPRISNADLVVALENNRSDLVWVISTYNGSTYYGSLFDGTSFGPAVTFPAAVGRVRSTSKTSGWATTAAGAAVWNGTAWSLTTEPLGSYAPVSATDAFRIRANTKNGAIEKLENGTWTSTGTTAGATETFGFLDAVSGTDAIALTDKGSVFHFDGNAWTKLASSWTVTQQAFPDLGIYAGNKRVYVNHTSFDLDVLSFDGVCWRSMPMENQGKLSGSPELLFFTRDDANRPLVEVYTLAP